MKRQVTERYQTDCGELVVPGTFDPAPSGLYVRAEVADKLLEALVLALPVLIESEFRLHDGRLASDVAVEAIREAHSS